MFLLKPALLSIPRLLAVNFHASLLPAYRGKHPVFWALRNGERQAGLTAHVMDPHFDTGDILYQVRVRTRKLDTVSSLYDRIIEKSVSLVPRLIADAANGTLRRIPQLQDDASYFSSVSEADFHLDWTRPAESLRRWIQISPGECWRMMADRRVYFLDAKVIRYRGTATPGQLIRLGRYTATLATGQDALVVRWVTARGWRANVPFARLCTEMGLKVGRCIVTDGGECHLPRSTELMTDAERGGYAVGYFESWNLESLLAVCDAAEATRSPVLLGFSGIYLPHPARVVHEPLSLYAALGLEAIRRLSVPACLVFNESPDFEWVLEAIGLGFGLVMFSDETLSFDGQVEQVRQGGRQQRTQPGWRWKEKPCPCPVWEANFQPCLTICTSLIPTAPVTSSSEPAWMRLR